MPPSVPTPATSDWVQGTATTALPLTRRNRFEDRGPEMITAMSKRADEILAAWIDLGRWLDEDERITAARARLAPVTDPALTVGVVQYAPLGLSIQLTGGADGSRYIVMMEATTSKGRTQTVLLAVYSSGTSSVPGGFTISITDAVVVGNEEHTGFKLSTYVLSFGEVEVGENAQRSIIVTNTGNVELSLLDIAAAGSGITFTTTCGASLEAGGTCRIDLTFAPTVAGATTTGSVQVETSAGTKAATLTGQAADAPIVIGDGFVASGSGLYRDGELFRIKAINWFGAENNVCIPHGLWQVSYKALIDQIAAWGFNAIRLPFSGDTATGTVTPGNVNTSVLDNHDFIASGDPEEPASVVIKSPLQCLDIIINYAATKGLYVILDHHRRHAGDGADGSPVDGTYTEAQWRATWTAMATRYASFPNVIGADLHNEPHDLTWAAWAAYAEGCADAIHAVAPEWLIFVEGVGTYNGASYWWGGQLAGVADRPVVIGKQDKLVYSPHEYGQSVGAQSWLKTTSQSVAGYPDNLPAVWDAAWGFIPKQGIAPIWIGEFGGKLGWDGSGAVDAAQGNAAYEKQWLAELVKYLNGDTDADGVQDIHLQNFAFWCLNPNSGDTGGMLCDDWVTTQSGKLALIQPLFDAVDTIIDNPPSAPTLLAEDGNTAASEDGYTIVGEDD